MNQKVVLLWTNSDKDAAFKMVFMYAHYSIQNKWWQEVEIIIWGSTTKLASEDKEIANELSRLMTEDGVKISACITCADSYGGNVTEKLRSLGADVKPMGPVLTEYLKSGIHVLTV